MAPLRFLIVLLLSCTIGCWAQCDVVASEYDPLRDYFPHKVDVQEASFFSVRYEKSYKVVTVTAPSIFPSWQPSGVFYNATYVLVMCGTERPPLSLFPEGTRFFYVPLRRIGLDSTTQVVQVEVLGELDTIFAYNHRSRVIPISPCFQRRNSTGSIGPIESWFGANETRRAEEIALQSLDAQFSWPRLPHPKTISVPETSDPSVLGRAEWLKFWSLWFNKEEIANRVWEGVVSRWQCHQEAARAISSRFGVMPPRVAWITHTPTSVSFVTSDFVLDYLRAAGADVSFVTRLSQTTVPTATALQLLQHVDYVVDDGGRFTSFSTLLSNLGLTDYSGSAYPWLTNRQVWTHDAVLSPSGATDWFEGHLAEPDVVLEDLMAIFYPFYQPNHRRVWFRSSSPLPLPFPTFFLCLFMSI